MLDNNFYIQGCKDDAERSVACLLLAQVPEDCADKFVILHDAADKMDEFDTLTAVDKIALALVNCVDEDVIIVPQSTWVSEMESRFFDDGEFSTNDMRFLDCEQIVADLESEYRNECNYDWSDFHDSDNQSATLYDYLIAHGERMNFTADDLEQYALKLIEDCRVCNVEDYFKAEEYAMSFLSIGGSNVFGHEVYEKDGTVLTTPNFNYDICQSLCLACEEMVYAVREGGDVTATRAEVVDQLEMMGFEVEPEMDETKRKALDELIKAADEFFTYPEGFEPPEKSKSEEVR